MNLQVVAVSVEVIDRGRDVVLVLEEDKCNVVGLSPVQSHHATARNTMVHLRSGKQPQPWLRL